MILQSSGRARARWAISSPSFPGSIQARKLPRNVRIASFAALRVQTLTIRFQPASSQEGMSSTACDAFYWTDSFALLGSHRVVADWKLADYRNTFL